MTDDEVREVLARASAVALYRGASPDAGETTLDDLMAAAAEAGMDPAEVRRAAALAPMSAGGLAGRALGAPDRRELTAFLPGASLPDAPQRLARTAEAALGRPGRVLKREDGTFAWEERHAGGGTRVVVTSTPDGVEVRATLDRAGRYLGLWFAGLAAWAGLAGLTPVGAVLGLPATVVGFVVAPLLLARPFRARIDRAARREGERLVMALLRTVEEGDAR